MNHDHVMDAPVSPAPTQRVAPASPGEAKPAITLAGIGKYFDALEVLHDIRFDVMQGEIVALLGTSGCGKSTLLNIVSGLLPYDDGELFIDGEAAARYTNWRSIAYMFQEDRLLPWRSTRDNVAFGLEAQGVAKAERRARTEEALALVGLTPFADVYPHQLSGGMRSRVALARSLVTNPAILLMDEPFSKLDPQTRAQMHTEVLRIQALKGTTVLFVTHDVEEAIVLANRVVVLAPRPGRVKHITRNTLAHPRLPTEPDVAEAIRALRVAL